jgi:hypothetical protein
MEYEVRKTEQSGGRECRFNLGLRGLGLFETMFIKQTRIIKFKQVGEQCIVIRLQNQYRGAPPHQYRGAPHTFVCFPQLQDTLLQKEEELARLHEENNHLRQYLNSTLVKRLEEKAKVCNYLFYKFKSVS